MYRTPCNYIFIGTIPTLSESRPRRIGFALRGFQPAEALGKEGRPPAMRSICSCVTLLAKRDCNMFAIGGQLGIGPQFDCFVELCDWCGPNGTGFV